MKITEVRTIVTCPTRNYVIAKIVTDEGVYGVGEGTLNGSEAIVAAAIEHMGKLLIGRDPSRIEDLWHMLYHWGYWRGGPIYMAALAALDIALWDIKGKVAGLPVYQLLGGRAREGVLCYGHGGGRDFQEIADSVRSYQARGYKVVRAQFGQYGGAGVLRTDPPTPGGHPNIPGTTVFEPTPYLATTPRLFEYLRQELGPEVELLHDVHEQLTPNQAAWLARALEPYRLFYLEDILRPEHKESFRLVRQASTTSLAIGEIFVSRWDCLPLFQEQLIDFIRVKPIHVGGITEFRKIMTLAEPFMIKSACHGAADIGPIGQAASLHVQVVIPNFGVQEWTEFSTVPEIVEVFPTPCTFKDGYANPHETPGIGIDIDEQAAAKYPYQERWMPLVRRLDGTVHVY
jgi:mannonate dehydratase